MSFQLALAQITAYNHWHDLAARSRPLKPEPRKMPARPFYGRADERYREVFQGKVLTVKQVTAALNLKSTRGVIRTLQKLAGRGLVAERTSIKLHVHGKPATRWEWIGP